MHSGRDELYLKETRNSYFWVTPQNYLLFFSWKYLKKHCLKKSNCVF